MRWDTRKMTAPNNSQPASNTSTVSIWLPTTLSITQMRSSTCSAASPSSPMLWSDCHGGENLQHNHNLMTQHWPFLITSEASLLIFITTTHSALHYINLLCLIEQMNLEIGSIKQLSLVSTHRSVLVGCVRAQLMLGTSLTSVTRESWGRAGTPLSEAGAV